MQKKQLQNLICQAFASNQYPGDENISDSNDYESNQVVNWLKGRHWKSLQLDELASAQGYIWALTPKAYSFYLPAYLLSALEVGSGHVYDSVLNTFLLRSHREGAEESFQDRVKDLDLVQRQAVIQFFRYVHKKYNDNDAKAIVIALESEWNFPQTVSS